MMTAMNCETRQHRKRLFLSNWSLLILILVLFPCIETRAGGAEPALRVSPPAVQPISLQQQEAVELFKKIFELSYNNNKADHIERIRELYVRIIRNCPDVPLAQESYFQLIGLYFNDYTPPLRKEAIELFAQFKSRYPDSQATGVIKYAMAKGCYVNNLWEELVELESPSVEEYFTTGKIDSPLTLFFYSEAKYNLHESEAAVRGYSALVENFPDTLVAQTAQEKIARIKHLRE